MDSDRDRTWMASAAPWAVAIFAVAAAVAALVLRALSTDLASEAGELYLADVWMSVVLPPAGAYLWTRTRARLLGSVLLSTALMSVGSVAALLALERNLDGRDDWIVSVGSWLGTWTWAPYLLVLAVVPMLVPDGRPASPRWRPVVVAGFVAVGAIAIVASVTPGPLEPYTRLTNPVGIDALSWLARWGETVSGATVATFLILGLVSVVMRWRRASTTEDRRRVQVFVGAVGLWAVTVVGAGSLPYPWIDLAPALGLSVVVVALVASVTTSDMAEETKRAQHRMVTAREDERFRVHRDLHDGLGPELAGLALRLNAIGALVENDAARLQLGSAEEALRRTVEEVRRIVDDLRPPVLDQIGLVRALRQRAADLADASGVDFAVRTDIAVGLLPPAVEVAAYRIACEAMTNVVRHAGARQCRVRLRAEDSTLTVDVEDDGVGIVGRRHSGVGHHSMQVRAEELGGQVRSSAGTGGQGLRITAALPLTQV